jgi:hypothetical protein
MYDRHSVREINVAVTGYLDPGMFKIECEAWEGHGCGMSLYTVKTSVQ